ncbi:MAG: Gfo/Idh/MocA family oxidoreductase [Methylovulum sp.]|uniref:Gfo/Idh/MocA family protein n=1 Tax=Methylovulum sp. TaxID=1916980 RepID=UPI00262BE59B|nr:Gfo/Idh/MocA family oxidoreductase [Methylovulum sp.]MDD2723163.1 Gfo/Idh/MocA family oxidoreductase [Methylovulum sp.]MDD5125622.1 Gfo/Idh/MocA family oxidoreductase [Methylovulum sp.]
MNNPSPLRFGILGGARINERMLPAIIEAHNAELIAIASRREGAAAETLARYAPQQQGVKTYHTLDGLLNDSDVQAVYIPLANHEHAEWTLRAIEHGKHVLCEKPMALAVNDILAIQTAARRHQVTVMEGFMYRFHPQHARVLELIQSGLFGDIRSVRATFSFMMRPERMYRLEEPISRGGGAMWDIGCYAIHTLRMFFQQEPIAVTALSQTVASGADIAASGVLDFGDGKYAQFDFSFARARRCEYEIIGTKGGLVCHVVWQLPGDVPMLTWWTDDGRQTEERLPAANHFRLEVEHFSQCVLAGTEPKLSLDDAESNCRTINAALQSAQEGWVVRLAGMGGQE